MPYIQDFMYSLGTCMVNGLVLSLTTALTHLVTGRYASHNSFALIHYIREWTRFMYQTLIQCIM